MAEVTANRKGEPSPPQQNQQQGYYQQPSTQQSYHVTNVVLQQQPQTITIIGQPQNIRPWTTGICGCFEDFSSCCFAYWCYPCFMCNLANNMNENCCGPYCCGSGCKCTGLHYCGVPNPFVTAMRSKTRAQYGIQGNICDDVICACCCECCVATQIARELKNIDRRR